MRDTTSWPSGLGEGGMEGGRDGGREGRRGDQYFSCLTYFFDLIKDKNQACDDDQDFFELCFDAEMKEGGREGGREGRREGLLTS